MSDLSIGKSTEGTQKRAGENSPSCVRLERTQNGLPLGNRDVQRGIVRDVYRLPLSADFPFLFLGHVRILKTKHIMFGDGVNTFQKAQRRCQTLSGPQRSFTPA